MGFGLARLGVVALAAMMVLAGCSGGGTDGGATEATPASGDDGGTATEDAGGEANGTPADDGADAGSGQGAADDADAASGSGGGSLTALEAPLAAIDDAESYTATYTVTSDDPFEGRVESEGVFMVADDGTQFSEHTARHLDVESGANEFRSEQYLPADEDVSYGRTVVGDDEYVFSRPRNDDDVAPAGIGDPAELAGASDASDAPQFRSEGVVSTDDGPRAKYVIDSLDQLASTAAEEGVEVRSVELVVYVDESAGRVTRVTYTTTVYLTELDGEQTVSMEFVYSDVGSTTVERPGWVDEA